MSKLNAQDLIENIQRNEIKLLPKQKIFLTNILYNDDLKFLWYI